MAEAYQAAFESAKERSGIGPLVEARAPAYEALARVFTAYSRCGADKAEWAAKLWWSTPLADNILSVTGAA